MAKFRERLLQAMEIRGMKQVDLVEATGLSKPSINQYVKGVYEPKQQALYKIAHALSVNVAWLMGYDVCMESSSYESLNDESNLKKKGVIINVLGRVAAGIPIEAVEEIIDTEEITVELAKTGKFFGLKIKGDSMSPNICDGDIVIVRQQEDAESGDIVIATINGDEATCKRLRKYKDGIELISNNPSYAPFEFSNKEISEKPVRIIGKVIELRRKF